MTKEMNMMLLRKCQYESMYLGTLEDLTQLRWKRKVVRKRFPQKAILSFVLTLQDEVASAGGGAGTGIQV